MTSTDTALSGPRAAGQPVPPQDSPPPDSPPQKPLQGNPLQDIASAVGRRGYLTTEWWTTVLAALLSAALGLVGLHGPAAAQVTGILAPILVAGVYAVVRTRHKSTLAQLAAAAFPQADPPAGA